MRPVLFELGSLQVRSYGVAGLTQPQLFAIGFMAAGALLAAWSRRTGAYTRGPDDSVPRRQLNRGDAARLAGGDD